MSLPASTTSSSMGGSAQEGNGLDREQRKAGQGELGGSKDKEDGGEAAAAVQASPFDRLPDELVSAILDFVAEDDLNKLDTFCLNRRFLRLAQPAWAACLAPTLAQQTRLLQRLGLKPHLQPLVLALHAIVNSNLTIFNYDCIIIRSFANLHTLSFIDAATNHDAAGFTLSSIFTDVLSSLPRLRSLELCFSHPFTLGDDTFSIGRSLPQLEYLALRCFAPQPRLMRQLLKDACPKLRGLDLRILSPDEEVCTLIPWTTLRNLHLCLPFPQTASQMLPAILGGLKRAVADVDGAMPPFASFNFENDVLLREDSSYHLGCNNPQIPALFALLKVLQPRQVVLAVGAKSDLIVPDGLEVVPGVEELLLGAYGLDANTPENALHLYRLIQLFPSVTKVILDGSEYGPPIPVDYPHGPTSPAFFFERSNLLALLHGLRQTAVLNFHWLVPVEETTYRWWRTKVEEDFEVEVLRPF